MHHSRMIESLESRRLLASIPPGFTETIIGGLSDPTAFAIAPDGRVFVAEQCGAVRVIEDGVLLPDPFVTVPTTNDGERGLLGITFHPQFGTQPFVYLYYTAHTPVVQNVVVRVLADGNVASGSEERIFELDPLNSIPNHNGGAINFGPDGKLYVATGENTVVANSQSLNTTLGKMLRINADGSIPSDNPFSNDASVTGNNKAIWALGLRNPFTFAFQPGTGRMFINDVGGNNFEEINEGIAGANYGWPIEEGPSTDPDFVSPLFSYSHDPECAITGGAFYNPTDLTTFPAEFIGKYFFADLCGGWIRTFDPATGAVADFASNINVIDYLQVGNDGALYYLARGSGSDTGIVGVIQATDFGIPTITTQPQSARVARGYPVTFSVAAGGEDLAYQWSRNGEPIDGATGPTLTIDSVGRSDHRDRFSVTVSNESGSVTSEPVTLRVLDNRAPSARILTPTRGTKFRGGDIISFSGEGTDPESDSLDASAFSWRVDFHHRGRVDTLMSETAGIASGTVSIPNTGETSTRVFYRIHLTITDPGGKTRHVTRTVRPVVSHVVIRTSPEDQAAVLDGLPIDTPARFSAVSGMQRVISASDSLLVDGVPFTFVGWSDGGAQSHVITVPDGKSQYTAIYRPTDGAVGIGEGLTATYFNNRDFTELAATRIDPAIDFVFGNRSPTDGVEPEDYSIRWRGQVQPQFTARWTFHTTSNDGVRVAVNGQALIDRLGATGTNRRRGSTDLVAGERYDIEVEYVQRRGDGSMRLFWSAPGIPRHIIPTTQLFPEGPITQSVFSKAPLIKLEEHFDSLTQDWLDDDEGT